MPRFWSDPILPISHSLTLTRPPENSRRVFSQVLYPDHEYLEGSDSRQGKPSVWLLTKTMRSAAKIFRTYTGLAAYSIK